MMLKEAISEAYQALSNHRLRAGLTLLGIAWGIVTVVLLMSYGDGFHAALTLAFHGSFSDGTVALEGATTSTQAGGERAGKQIRLELEDVDALKSLGLIKYASPEYVQTLSIGYRTRQTSAPVRGVASEYGLMRNEAAETGRFLNQEDIEKRRRVVFLGYEVTRRLFRGRPAQGESVRIGGLSFQIIGTMPNKPEVFPYYLPDRYCVFIPYTTVGDLWSDRYLYMLVFQMLDPHMHDQAIKQVREVLGQRHRFDPRDERALQLYDSVKSNKTLNAVTGGLKIVLGFIGALTLVIGGVGVMNIMLVSVTERTREIGLRKALGARQRHIILQFLMESLAVTFAGGAIGALLALALAGLIGSRPFLAGLIEDPSKNTDIHLRVSSDLLLPVTCILVLVGLLSGLWPAVRAARVDPIEALRHE